MSRKVPVQYDLFGHETTGRLAEIVGKVAGIKSLSSAIDYAAQFTADRLKRSHSKT